MDAKEFIKKVRDYNPKPDEKIIVKAFNFSKKMHEGQKRKDGKPYFDHPLNVALLLMKLKAGSSTLSAALLHDILEDTKYTKEDMKKEFGADITSIVVALTNLDKIDFISHEDYSAENMRKILLASTKDIRVILIKLCDRLHNIKTISTFNLEKQQRIAKETLEIYAPIAHKLGMWWIKGELEDLSLRVLEPEIYFHLKEKIHEKRAERENTTEWIIKRIKSILKERGIHAEVSGRAKYFYSIYKKMIRKNLSIDEIYDLIAIRIILKTIPDCYSVLGILHELWTPIPRRFKDYIANPKDNGYQSLHTVLNGPNDKHLEVQIRTEEMHYFAEDGVAAHWRYQGTDRDKKFDKKISWIKQLLEWRRSTTNAKDFIETLKLDLFEDQIVVFTPKGDPITLREGATPIDFAYEVHTTIGEHCSKAIVNGKIAPLNKTLNPGDVVEIITSRKNQVSRQWLKFVVSSKARSKIKSVLGINIESDTKKQAKGESVNLLNLIGVEGKQYPVKLSKCCNPKLGDNIVGFLTKDKKVTIHKKNCPNVYTLSKKVKVYWKKSLKVQQEIVVVADEKAGFITEILNDFLKEGITINKINSREGRDQKIRLTIGVSEKNSSKLLGFIRKLREKKEIQDVSVRK